MINNNNKELKFNTYNHLSLWGGDGWGGQEIIRRGEGRGEVPRRRLPLPQVAIITPRPGREAEGTRSEKAPFWHTELDTYLSLSLSSQRERVEGGGGGGVIYESLGYVLAYPFQILFWGSSFRGTICRGGGLPSPMGWGKGQRPWEQRRVGATAGMRASSTSYSTSLPGYLLVVEGGGRRATKRPGQGADSAPTAAAGPRLSWWALRICFYLVFWVGKEGEKEGWGKRGGGQSDRKGMWMLLCFVSPPE